MRRNISHTMYPSLFSFLFLGILILFFALSGIYFLHGFPERSATLWLFCLVLVFFLSWMNVYHIDRQKLVVRRLLFPKKREIFVKNIKRAEIRKVLMYPGLMAAVLFVKADKGYYFSISINYGAKNLGKFLGILKNILGKRIVFK